MNTLEVGRRQVVRKDQDGVKRRRFFNPHGKPPWLVGFSALLAVVLVLRALLPVGVEWFLNHRILNNAGSYTGHVGDVDLALMAGIYKLEKLQIRKQSGDPGLPFLALPQASIALSWRSLLQGQFSFDIILQEPELNFLDASAEEDRQSGKGTDWQTLFDQLVPVRLNSAKIVNGVVRFQNQDSQPEINLVADQIHLSLFNLTNIEDKRGERVAEAQLDARVFESSNLEAEARLDPFDFSDFYFAAELTDLDLRQLNNFGKVYANLDFANGSGDVFMEVKAQERKLSGYIKPFLENVEILDWEQDVEQDQDNIFKVVWEGAVDFVETLFTNDETDKLATQIEIEGSLEQGKVETWSAVWGVVKNAFVQALDERFNRSTPLTEDGSA